MLVFPGEVIATMFHSILIANRGEIAVRVIQACRELGVRTVAVYSDADAGALHVRAADQAVWIGPAPARESYLNAGAIIAAARGAGVQAVHPGYGFLSENADFAQACADAGLTFIGPSPDAIRLMGSKIEAKRLAASLGVPLLPGYDGTEQDADVLNAEAARIGFPVLIKASAGGGGRGMRVVQDADSFMEALEGARREALAAFGDDAVLLERNVARPRHVEVQVFGDSHGTILHLGERDCTVQRRHQKVIEEAPSPALTSAQRTEMGDTAVRLASAIGYVGAGTVEFLLDEDGRFAFLEMNTRLQVEHGVTELVTGLDLVHLQLRIAAGEPLPLTQEDVRARGHAIECRIYAEDPAAGFLPSTGRLTAFAPPLGPGIRNDIGFETGDMVSPYYDAMLAKLLCSGTDRTDAVERMAGALRRYLVAGVTTNIPLLLATITNPAFRSGEFSTGLLDQEVLPSLDDRPAPEDALLAAALALAAQEDADPWRSAWRPFGAQRTLRFRNGGAHAAVTVIRTAPDTWTLRGETDELEGQREAGAVWLVRGVRRTRFHVDVNEDTVDVTHEDGRWRITVEPPPDAAATAGIALATGGARTVRAPLTGTVLKIAVSEGETVRARQPLVILEAMKMEHTLTAPAAGTVARIQVAPGDLVQAGTVLVEMSAI